MIYNIDNKFLYEILDDYSDATTDSDKNDIIQCFMQLIWSSKNKRRVFKKKLKFTLSNSEISTDTGNIFNQYSEVEYIYYKSRSKETDFASLIRQKLNNIYSNLCDSRICTKKEYMDLIKLPKQMYYRWKKGEIFDSDTLESQLKDIINHSETIKDRCSKQKLDLSWSDYKKLTEGFFTTMFNNYIPLDDFEDKTQLIVYVDTCHEDHFSISYLCKGLDGYMRNFQKECHNVPRNKKYSYCDCGQMIVQNKNNNRFKCDRCSDYSPIVDRVIVCIDCGVKVEIGNKDNKTIRCKECYKTYRREYKARKERERRAKLKR